MHSDTFCWHNDTTMVLWLAVSERGSHECDTWV